MDPQEAAALVREHLTGPVAAEEWVQHVEFDPELDRWYLRFTCDGRDATTIYFDLRPRSLRYEVYFMPDPPKNHLELYRWLLRRNHVPPSLLAAELWGGVVGLLGGYERSRRRVGDIRRGIVG